MLYLVQKNIFRETNYDLIFKALEKLGLDYEIVEYNDDTASFDFKTERKDVFPFGSIKMAKLSAEMNWYPGSFFGNNHDFEIYSKFYGDNLLNYDSEIHKFGDILEWGYNEMKFIRPCKDSKLITGGLFTKTKWEDMVQIRKESKFFTESILDDLIQVGKPKKIYKEARCWVVDGKIVTSSYYKFGEHVAYEEHVEPEGLEFAQRMVDLYQVAPAFVIDICLTPDGWKIVEINCINCSGFYKGDLQKILIALENKYSPEILPPGTMVRMSDELKQGFINNDCKDHVDEFGDCVGFVEDRMFDDGDEVNVRWKPSNLRYGYPSDMLVVINKEV